MSTVTDEIKARVDLVELIGRTVPLKRAGSSYRGLCPFHTEKTPSFYVRPQTNTYHCFGCGKGGSAFDWLMEREHLEFSEALRVLAQLTGVALPERRAPSEDEQVQRLYTALERAQTFYAAALWGTAGERARAYLQRRGLTEETLRAFGIGYAPPGSPLLRYLAADGFNEQELQAAGVISVADDGRPFDFFRERVLFPIRDAQGRTIAFGGRSLDDGAQPKYLNTRDTLLFHKHETMFALDMARRPMAQERQVVIVEGYMDAAMAHQHGFRNVVATLGTSITEQHLRVLRRQVDEIVLALDPDAAGQSATWRTLQVADATLRTGFTPVVAPSRNAQRTVGRRDVRLLVMQLPDGKDPDELIRSQPTAWTALVRGAMPVIDFVLERLAGRHDLSTAGGKAAAAADVVEVLAGIANPIEQDHYLNLAADTLKVDPASLRRMLRRASSPARRPQPNTAVGEAAAGGAQVKGNSDDEYLVALMLHLRAMPDAPRVDGELEFVVDEYRALYRSLDGEVPPELQPYLERAQRFLPDVERLPTQRLAEELEMTRLRIRTELQLRQTRQLAQMLREGADRSEVEPILDRTLEQLRAIGGRSGEQESVGTR